DSQTAIKQLGAGQSITDSFTAVSFDGTASQVVTVTINGTNDVPVIGGVATGSVTQDAAMGTPPAGFDALNYISSSASLIQTFGTNTAAAEQEYIQTGYAQGRHPYFDAQAYINSYPDLQQAFGTNTAAGEQHFIQFGFSEGRQPAFTGFNAAQYLANYPDLRAAFGTDLQAAYQHFVQFGFREGRTDQALTNVDVAGNLTASGVLTIADID